MAETLQVPETPITTLSQWTKSCIQLQISAKNYAAQCSLGPFLLSALASG
jgi:hypothetical protein